MRCVGKLYNDLMADDYYKTLGVSRSASQDDIRKAYFELARKFHPDKNPEKDAKKKFQKIQAAFDVLNDPQKRELYDRYGSSFETMGAGGPRGPGRGAQGPGGGFGGGPQGFEDVDFTQFFGDKFGAEGGPDLSDIFNQFRRTAGRSRKPGPARRRGSDVEHEMTVPFQTAISGGDVQIRIESPSGKGETLTVKIPAGIEEGKKIRLRGQGEAVPSGGTPGDLLITIHVTPHPFFQRKGDHLLLRVPVTLGEAAFGAKIDVPTPQGAVSLRVPPGTSSGTKLRIKGHGVVPKSRPPGDLLAEIQIMIPKTFDESDRQAIEAIDRKHELHPRAELRW
jgi:DnaJ-class molecular chaperone